jgi:signal peptidase II
MKATTVFFFKPQTDANICATHKVKSTHLKLTAIALDAFLIEGLIKVAVMVTLPVGSAVPLIPSWLTLWHTENTGVAFSAGATLPMWVLSLLTGFMLLAMTLYVYNRVVLKSPLQVVSIALLLAGGWNNWLDRTLTGAVTDYISVAQFPVFNCSDMFITVGCVLLLVYTLFPDRFTQAESAETTDTALPYLDHTTQTVMCASDVAKLKTSPPTTNNNPVQSNSV